MTIKAADIALNSVVGFKVSGLKFNVYGRNVFWEFSFINILSKEDINRRSPIAAKEQMQECGLLGKLYASFKITLDNK